MDTNHGQCDYLVNKKKKACISGTLFEETNHGQCDYLVCQKRKHVYAQLYLKKLITYSSNEIRL